MDRNQRRPPDVEEALSSMLWTPYERTTSDSSSDEDEKLNSKLKKSKSSFDYNCPTYYVPSYRKIERYDNFRFSYPYYGHNIPNTATAQKCISELPSYESLYHNVTPVFSSLTTGLSSGLVHSFTDNFIGQDESTMSSPLLSETAAKLLHITSSVSGFSSNIIDHQNHNSALGLVPTLVDDNSILELTNKNDQRSAGPIGLQLQSITTKEGKVLQQDQQYKLSQQHQLPYQQRQFWQHSNNNLNCIPFSFNNKNDSADVNSLKKIHFIQQQQKSQRFNSAQQTIIKDLVDLPEQPDDEEELPRVSKLNHHHQQQQQYKQYGLVNSSYQFAVDRDYSSGSAAAGGGGSMMTGIGIMVTAANVAATSASINGNINMMNETQPSRLARMTQTDVAYAFSLARTVESNGSLSSVASGLSCFDATVNSYGNSDDDQLILGSSESDDIQNITIHAQEKLSAMRLSVPAATAASTINTAKNSNNITEGATNSNCNTSTTSVFFPLNDQNSVETLIAARNLITNGTLTGAIVPQLQPQLPQPSLKIQVNQHNSDTSIINRVNEHDRNSQNLDCDHLKNAVNQSIGAGVSVVSCYSGSVPQINSVVNNDRDEVNIVPAVITTTTTIATSLSPTGTTIIRPNGSSVSANNNTNNCNNGLKLMQMTNEDTQFRILERTFTSTECQTEDLPLDFNDINNSNPLMGSTGGSGIIQNQTEALISREQRRRERRERRHSRNRHPHVLPPPPPPVIRPVLPDILHSHFPPPYTALSLTNPPPPPSSLMTPVISTVPIPASAVNDGRFSIPLPVIRRSPSERSGKGCCGQWFAGPPLRALIAVVALGGVACALGGAALGATGLTGPPTSHLTAALLMIGVGVILVTVSGAAWRMTAPGGPPCLGLGSSVDLGRCGRRPCSSRGGAPHGLLYPEFQHRPPPPSYQASMQEYRLRLLLLDRDRQNGVVRGGSPPPTYRSHAGSLLRTPLSTTTRSGGGGGGGGGGVGGGPGSEYSLPPSYRSRNANNNNTANSSSSSNNNNNNTNHNNNTNTIITSSSINNNNNSSLFQTSALGGDESFESLGSGISNNNNNNNTNSNKNNFNILLSSNSNVLERNFTSEVTTSRTNTTGVIVSHEQSFPTSSPPSSTSTSPSSSSSSPANRNTRQIHSDGSLTFSSSSPYQSSVSQLSQPILIPSSTLAAKDQRRSSITAAAPAAATITTTTFTTPSKVLQDLNSNSNTTTTTVAATLVKNCMGGKIGGGENHSQSQILKEKLNPRVITSSCSNNSSPSYIISSPSSRNSLNSTKCNSEQHQHQHQHQQLVCTATSVGAITTTTAATTTTTTNNNNNNNQRKELVTIVTISACQGPEESQSEMEILAHL